MDVTFEIQKGESFTIEIGYFDTVLEIKEKIQKYKEIPISDQTLVYNGKVLEDHGDVDSCVILDSSHIRLIVANQHEQQPNSPEQLTLIADEFQCFSPIPISKKTQVFLRFPSSKSYSQQKLPIDVDLGDSVAQLKEKLYQIEGFPARGLVLYLNRNIELQDQKYLQEYELKDGSEIDVMVRTPLAPTPSGTTNAMSIKSTKKLQVGVLTRCGTKRLIVDVNPMDKVRVLRNELEKLQQTVSFQLPPEGYFFIYNQTVMEEKQTFYYHNVRQGDTIDIFNGTVSGGED